MYAIASIDRNKITKQTVSLKRVKKSKKCLPIDQWV